MARSHLRHTVTDRAGNTIQNATVTVYVQGTSTLVNDLYAAASGGSAVAAATLISNAQGEVEGWLATPKTVDLQVSDTSHTAYYSGQSGPLLSWTPFTETVEVLPPPENLGLLDASQSWTGVNTFTSRLVVDSDANENTIGPGTGVLGVLTSGLYNTGSGDQALAGVTSGSQNTGFGRRALTTCSTATGNTGVGINALYYANGDFNTGIGQVVGVNITSGVDNTLSGAFAGWGITTGSYNTADGYSAICGNGGTSRLTGDYNTFTGTDAGIFVANAATQNTGMGAGAGGGADDTTQATGSDNSWLGFYAGRLITTGSRNVGVGSQALWQPNGVSANATKAATGTIAIGYQAGASSNADPSSLTCVGYKALGAANAVALGATASASATYAVALGNTAAASASGAVAIGCDSGGAGASTSVANELKLGTANHSLNVIGNASIAGAAKTLAFYGVTGVTRPSAYTQTYATATKTHSGLTSATLTDNSAGTANTTVEALPDPADTPASADALRDDLVANLIPALRNNVADLTAQVNALRVDVVNAKGVLNAVIDDGQSLGLLS